MEALVNAGASLDIQNKVGVIFSNESCETLYVFPALSSCHYLSDYLKQFEHKLYFTLNSICLYICVSVGLSVVNLRTRYVKNLCLQRYACSWCAQSSFKIQLCLSSLAPPLYRVFVLRYICLSTSVSVERFPRHYLSVAGDARLFPYVRLYGQKLIVLLPSSCNHLLSSYRVIIIVNIIVVNIVVTMLLL